MPPDTSGVTVRGDRAGRHALLAVAATFAINGVVLSSLLPRYPQIAEATGASEAAFGLSLAAVGIGGFLGSSLVPIAARRIGLRPVVVLTGIATALAAVAVAVSPSVTALAVAFGLGGAADGAHDVSMNEVGLGEQSRRSTSVMGRLHGAWSLGATAAGAVGALMAGLGVPVAIHIGGMAALAIAAQVAVGRWLRERPAGMGVGAGGVGAPDPVDPVDEARARSGDPAEAADAVGAALPRRWTVLLLLAAATLAAMAAEGVALDWSALTLRRGLGATAGVAGLGPVVFSAGVLLGRVFTDPAVDRFGPVRVLQASGVLAAVAMGVGLPVGSVTGSPWPVLVALAVAGVGAASTFPLLFGAGDLVARRLRLPAGSGASIVGTLPRVGGLVLPVLVGLLASAFGLVPALGVMVVGALAVAVLLPRLLRV